LSFEATRTVVEPAGALALAGVIRHIKEGHAPDGDLVVTVSGANVNFDRIGHIVERAELGAGEEMLFVATIPERAGAFLNFVRALGRRAVTEFSYRYAPADNAHVLVGIKTHDMDERAAVVSNMAEQGIIYRFEFPERPGALTQFLEHLDARWNISLFHYRNHGSAEGHVLCGFHVPAGNIDALEASLAKTGYPMARESDNPAYGYFLKA